MVIAHKTSLIAFMLAVALAAAAQNPQAQDSQFQDPQVQAPQPGIVEGTVINAQNSRTIPRASVNLVGTEGGSKSTRADGSGHFIFQQVEPGHYKLMAERQGFFSDQHKREYQPIFEVAAGEHIKNMAVRLMPTAVVSGEIVDEFNDTLKNVEVKLLAKEMRLGQMYLRDAGHALTDDRGQYRISGFRPGKYYLVAEYKANEAAMQTFKLDLAERIMDRTPRSAGETEPFQLQMPDTPNQSFTYPPLFYPGSGDFQQAQQLQLKPGDELPANFIFVSAPVVSIKGRVVNGMTGAPAQNATAAAYWTDYIQGEGLQAKVSPKDGTFEINDVAPGLYKLRASFTQDGQMYEGEQTVEVGVHGAQNVDVAAMPEFAVAGHVTVVSDGRTVIKRVPVEFVGEGLMLRVQASANSPEFKFDAQLRPDRRYRVNALRLGQDYYLKSVLVSGHEVPPDNLVVSGYRGDLELVLSPAGGHIEGTLFDGHDQTTRGSILLVPDLPDPGPPELFRRTSAGTDGKFIFRGVAPGSYRMVAMESPELDDQVNDPDFAKKVVGRGDSISVAENGKYAVSMRLNNGQ
ncbi:MAG TPA: carboxypeptidase-like regulatory domain-containing protein [Candidatus Angelobacter sp.]|nr:carboxypeptidase-like regulatory domain-containing protein [Candidatus Angelobacter sp.]